LLATTHPPVPLRDPPGGQTSQGFFRHGLGPVIPAIPTGSRLLNGCRRNERTPFFSGAAFSLAGGSLPDGGVFALAFDAVAPVLATCAAEPLELWLLADEMEPPE
jgi:hypothetical protein